MQALVLIWLVFAAAATGLPYLIARKRAGSFWGAVAPAYSAGLIAPSALLIAGSVLLNVRGASTYESKMLFGPFFWSILLGPPIGLLMARMHSQAPGNQAPGNSG